MKYERKKARAGILAPNIQRGGTAIPLGNNLYWMKGRTHAKGGIDIGKDLEVENNEVMQMLPNETRVFSSVKMLGGNSPAELVASGMNPNMVFNAQEAYKKINRIRDDGSIYKRGGKAKLGKRIKIKAKDGDRDIYYDDVKRRWVWGKNKVVLPYGHRVKFSDGYEYQLNSDGTRTRIGKKPNAAERAVTAPMKYTPNNDIPTATLDVMTAPLADDDKLYYNGILPLHNPSIYKDAPLYAYRTGDMSYLRNDDTSIYTPVRRARQDLPRKLYEFYNQDTIYMPSSLIENVDRLKQGITINQENVDPSYVYGPNNRIAIDARNHNMQIRNLGNSNYVADFSDIFDTNKEFFDSKANPMIFSQFGVPIVFTDDESKINQSFINEVNKGLGKKYGGRKRAKYGYDENGNPIYGLTEEYPYPLKEVVATANKDTMYKAMDLFNDDLQRRIMLDQEYDLYRKRVSRLYDYYVKNNYTYSSRDSKDMDEIASEMLERGINDAATIDDIINNLYHIKLNTNHHFVTPFNYEIDEIPEPDETTSMGDEAFRSWYLGENKEDADTMFIPRYDLFNGLDVLDNYISELSHHIQHEPGNKELLGTPSNKFYLDEYDNWKPSPEEYEKEGNIEYNAHNLIEPALIDFVYSKFNNDADRMDAYNMMITRLKSLTKK